MTLHEELTAFARESLGLSPEMEAKLIPLAGRGSDRTYFRFQWNLSNSAVLVHYEKTRIENAYYADIAAYLLKAQIPVPQIIRHDEHKCFIVMKDLGDTDLWSLRQTPWETRRNLYRKTLMVAHGIHSLPEEPLPSNRLKLAEPFGPNLYRWERNYFKDNFVVGLCRVSLDPAAERELEKELAMLADRLSSDRRCLVHRDLQSQNVMIYQDHPFLIDFQGMRFGSRFYDLGSLLCDPYVSMSGSERMELLSFYRSLSESDIGRDDFQDLFWDASAQRLMQALGAYGFLGIARGLKNYLRHVPSGLRNLRSATENAVSLPRLLEVCGRCEEALYASDFESRISNFEYAEDP